MNLMISQTIIAGTIEVTWSPQRMPVSQVPWVILPRYPADFHTIR